MRATLPSYPFSDFMLPIAIFRHVAFEGPGYLAEFFDARKIPWQLICVDAGEAVPLSAVAYAGLVFMGGPMSVNDDLPWIAQELDLIRNAVARDVPVLGHCLGAQLIARALGGVVSKNPLKEIGWGDVKVADNEVAHHWFGKVENFAAFHWHGETFTLPPGATRLLSSAHCVNQGYALGRHLALQCHIEMTAEMIATWCEVGAAEIAASSASPAVQSPFAIQEQMASQLAQLQQVATLLYSKWISGLTC
jgi:GMP synthase-like glutamine amidotransferase